ncbi:hypothetical protein KXW60_003596, partial [Aspergillus fumigatus]
MSNSPPHVYCHILDSRGYRLSNPSSGRLACNVHPPPYTALDKVAARHDQVREEAQEMLRAHQRA